MAEDEKGSGTNIGKFEWCEESGAESRPIRSRAESTGRRVKSKADTVIKWSSARDTFITVFVGVDARAVIETEESGYKFSSVWYEYSIIHILIICN